MGSLSSNQGLGSLVPRPAAPQVVAPVAPPQAYVPPSYAFPASGGVAFTPAMAPRPMAPEAGSLPPQAFQQAMGNFLLSRVRPQPYAPAQPAPAAPTTPMAPPSTAIHTPTLDALLQAQAATAAQTQAALAGMGGAAGGKGSGLPQREPGAVSPSDVQRFSDSYDQWGGNEQDARAQANYGESTDNRFNGIY